VPLTLLSWVRLVGDVWLVGTHPEWPASASADPLVIQIEGSHHPDHSIQDYFTGEWERWQEYAEKRLELGPFILDLSPDRLHKENVSGGPLLRHAAARRLRRWIVSRRDGLAVR
jgi:hypothetical protein